MLTNSRLKAVVATLLLAALVAVSWSARFDTLARDETELAFQRALIAFAAARTLNGVVSVAQGTELALQPAGVGVTFTPGQILDPLNDLIERFSWLVLVAATSLGSQMLLTEIFAQSWASALITATASVYVVALWWRPRPTSTLLESLERIVIATFFLRFFVVAVTFASTMIGEHFLGERQQLAIDTITVTTAELETPEAPETFLDQITEALDVDRQIEAFKTSVEIAISFLLDLMVTFLLQTVVFPIASATAGYYTLRAVWRRL